MRARLLSLAVALGAGLCSAPPVMAAAAPAQACDGCDLQVTVTPSVQSNDVVTLNITIENAGPGRMAFTAATASVGDLDPQPFNVPALDAGQTFPTTVVVDASSLAGQTTTARVEDACLKGETDCGNNIATTAPFEVPVAQPSCDGCDLAVSATPTVSPDRQVELDVVVANVGQIRSPAASVTVALDGLDSQQAEVPELDTGASSQLSFRFDATALAGETVSATVITPCIDGELDCGNNTLTIDDISIPALPPASTSQPAIPVTTGSAAGATSDPWPFIAGIAAAVLVVAAAVALHRRRVRRKPMAAPPPPPPQAAPAPPPAPPPPAPPPAPPQRVVNTGFSAHAAPDHPLLPGTPLLAHMPFLFWVDVGELALGTIETSPAPLPSPIAADADLDVAVFPLAGVSAEGATVGRIRVEGDGRSRVARPAWLPSGGETSNRRLFFSLVTGEAGLAVLRCSIYHRGVLVQSRLVRAHVDEAPPPGEPALASTLDYTLAPSLQPDHLAGIEPHSFSMLVNSTQPGTHEFTFMGAGSTQRTASFDAAELQDLIEQARGALRRACWNDAGPWRDPFVYRYVDRDLDRLAADLALLAVKGYRLFDQIVNRLAGGAGQVPALVEMMRLPGRVQVASIASARLVLPAAMLYDYDLDTGSPLDQLELCPAFRAALEAGSPLAESACFLGHCPSRGDLGTVCPSGFWGFRHRVGMPVSVADAPDVCTEIRYGEPPRMVVAVSTDPALKDRAAHEQALRTLRPGMGWSYASTRDEALALLSSGGAEIVYFYCHGGVVETTPYIQVGGLDERGITRDLLRAMHIAWDTPRPLVFINGCHTTALEPEVAIDFVSGLTENARAAGVIGTEITVFEPLADPFAERFLAAFLGGEELGEAVRRARLSLLEQGNPLGLVYIPYALANLRMVRE